MYTARDFAMNNTSFARATSCTPVGQTDVDKAAVKRGPQRPHENRWYVKLHLLVGAILCLCGALRVSPATGSAPAETDKTLVAWVALSDLDQRGGSALTLQSGDEFDAIVYGERYPRRWMAGSDFFRRTEANQERYPVEMAPPRTLLQIAIVYRGPRIEIYRNGSLYAAYQARNIDLIRRPNHIVVFGWRHIGAGTGNPLKGEIEDARIYDRALSVDEIRSLQPDRPSAVRPFAWWDFESDPPIDRMGHFPHSAMTKGARVLRGRLLLDGTGYMVAALRAEHAALATRPQDPRAPFPPYEPETPAWPKDPPPNWVTYHLAHPGPGQAFPGDPNCAFDYKGRYHLHYIYRNRTGFVFGHVSSTDLLHWRWHPTVLAPPTTGHGMFSGTGFFTKEGRPAIIYHGQGSGRNWIQFALDDSLDKWSAPIPVIPRRADGSEVRIRHWDPDCWRIGETYYAISGGQNPQLMKSTDLKNWLYLGDLLHPDYPEEKLGVARNEDISCPNMFRIGNKWMLLCISHRLGCRYYLGDFKDEKYLPDFHAMMSFGGNMFFAPESMLTRDGRRIMWAWLLNVPAAPTGIQCLPRELELPEDGVLRIRPLRELEQLRADGWEEQDILVRPGQPVALKGVTGDAVEVLLRVRAPVPPVFHVRLLGDENGREDVRIRTGVGTDGLTVGSATAPFRLAANENLELRIFVDKNLVEVFANDRQAVVYAHRHIRSEPGVRVEAEGAVARIEQASMWRIRSIYTASKH